jgi:hypothetical protein
VARLFKLGALFKIVPLCRATDNGHTGNLKLPS